MLDYLPHVRRDTRAPGAYKGHAKGARSQKRVLYLGHYLEGPVIRVQKELEMMIPLPEGDPELLHTGGLKTAFP